jgi:uncharacterized protein (DUF2267 family)
MRRKLMGLMAVAVAIVGLLLLRREHLRAVVRTRGDQLARTTRRLVGTWRGVNYRLRRRRPDPEVSDLVLADRIRSSIGRLEKQLDIPHVHVMVEEHVATLHGEVASPEQAASLEGAVSKISGVVGVESHLHVGLISGDTRPSSEGRHHASEALEHLTAAVGGAGVREDRARIVLKAVLGSISERLPGEQRQHLATHLPSDVRSMLEAPRRIGAAARLVRSAPQLIAAVVTTAGIDEEAARRVITAVFAELKRLVPEEAGKISTVFPKDLRSWWETAA